MRLLLIVLAISLLFGCAEKKDPESYTLSVNERKVSEEFKNYWHQGTAEITSYSLQQERYGEMREGNAVLIYVTEDFRRDVQVKADTPSKENVTVLKLNATKNFTTGIYPYSIMSSTFYPVYEESHPLKVSVSVQEWCGHVYSQINNRDKFEVTSHSYFEGEADQNFTMKKNWLEDELWTLLRIDPLLLPTGEVQIVPSLEYTRLSHKSISAMDANATLSLEDTLSNYKVVYPEAQRSLTIWFQKDFPYRIEKWEENIDGKSTIASRKVQINEAYWNKNANKDVVLRDSLLLN